MRRRSRAQSAHVNANHTARQHSSHASKNGTFTGGNEEIEHESTWHPVVSTTAVSPDLRESLQLRRLWLEPARHRPGVVAGTTDRAVAADRAAAASTRAATSAGAGAVSAAVASMG